MIGALIGDFIGSRFEFNNIERGCKDFELFHPECDFTDDSICTIAIADALVRGIAFSDALEEWCKRYPHPKGGYGGSFQAWIWSEDHKPYNSWGNGSAMRVSPVAYAAESLGELVELAHESAICTHNHPKGIKGAVFTAKAIALLRSFRKPANKLEESMAKSALIAFARDSGYSIPPLKYFIRHNQFDESCEGTIPVALACFTESRDFEDAIRNAISVGGDSDTIAAIVGSLAEAYYGVPRWMKDELIDRIPRDMLDVLLSFEANYEYRI